MSRASEWVMAMRKAEKLKPAQLTLDYADEAGEVHTLYVAIGFSGDLPIACLSGVHGDVTLEPAGAVALGRWLLQAFGEWSEPR